MEENTLLGLVIILVGVFDIVIARMLGDRLVPNVRSMFSIAGLGILGLGVLIALGAVKVL